MTKKKIKKKIKNITKSFEKESKKTRKRKEIDRNMLIPSGSTPLDLECSGHIEGSFLLGKMVNLIGDSHSGKTLLALTMVAECCHDSRFDDYAFYLDDVESACEFDIEYMFGESVAERLITPNDEGGIRSKTIEDFNDNIARLLDGDQKFIYILDSFDALTSEAAVDKDVANRKKREKGQKADGSYGDGKPKIFSDFCKHRNQDLDDHKSALFIISQTRDNLGFGAMFNPKTRSGGKALKFFSFHEIWLACQKREKKNKRTSVTNVQAKITKNKLTGRHGEAFFPILFDYGIDNVTACINFLLQESRWTGTKASINVKGWEGIEKNMKMSKLIDYIEENKLEHSLKLECKKAYDHAMAKMKPKRKPKYS